MQAKYDNFSMIIIFINFNSMCYCSVKPKDSNVSIHSIKRHLTILFPSKESVMTFIVHANDLNCEKSGDKS